MASDWEQERARAYVLSRTKAFDMKSSKIDERKRSREGASIYTLYTAQKMKKSTKFESKKECAC